MRKFVAWSTIAVLLVSAVLFAPTTAAARPADLTGQQNQLQQLADEKRPPMSGAREFGDVEFGTALTECPQAGKGLDTQPKPLDLRIKDAVERVSGGGNDRRANQDYTCFPQNETSIAVNPQNNRNVLGGANDYRLGWGSSGFYASTDGGNHFYDLVTTFPTVPGGRDHIDGGGDPAVVFDRAGVAYYVQIRFMRENDTNGIFVNRSTNGGFTWTRPCVPLGATDATAVCGGAGDPRQPGDGMVTFFQDQDFLLNGSVPFDDKEYVAAGPRPAGVNPVCFAPISRTARTCAPGTVGVDRLYVTWTRFDAAAVIMVSFSDDQARSWSPARAISGSAAFCAFGAGNSCDFNQFSTPTVSPHTGHLYVAFENFNTPDENQYLLVRSTDGGTTFVGPFFITPVFDVNYPRSGTAGLRPDCTPRGQQGGRNVLTNTCFRVNSGGNVVVDKRGGDFADDLYLVMSDNRNGTRRSSNTDVFLFKSTNGGSTWIGPTRVNNDRSSFPADRGCTSATDPACTGDFGNDQWFPWVDIGEKGDLVVVFEDRRLDEASTAIEWPGSRQRPGNYLVWYWGAQCRITTTAVVTTSIPAAAQECLAAGAQLIPQPTAPIDPGASVPGQGAAYLGPLTNFGISDVPSNWDYSFRAGIFAGDYSNVAVVGERAYTLWTDARNGRSSRSQPGRNPACEQADAFYEDWGASGKASGQNKPEKTDELFLVTPCPDDIKDN